MTDEEFLYMLLTGFLDGVFRHRSLFALRLPGALDFRKTALYEVAIAVGGHTFRRSGYGSVHLSESWEDGAPDPGEYASGTPDYVIYEGVQWEKRSLSVTISAAREGDLSAGGDE